MADPKEDQGKYPAGYQAEREAAQREEMAGGKTGLLRSYVGGWRQDPPVLYGPNDRQRYIQDVAKKAFEYQNPEQGPMTAYQASMSTRGADFPYGPEHMRPLSAESAEDEAREEVSARHRMGTRGEEPLPYQLNTMSESITSDKIRLMRETQKALEFAAAQRGMSVDELVEALEKSPSERGWDPRYENYTPPEDK